MKQKSGLAAYHPVVKSLGWDPVKLDRNLRNDTASLVKAGFNVYGRPKRTIEAVDRLNL